MGDRRQAVLHFDQVETPLYLHTHWGGHDLPATLARALERGRPRWNDEPYLARIIVSEMAYQTGVLAETGMGIAPYRMDSEYDDIHILLTQNQVMVAREVFTFEEFIEKESQ